MKNTDKNIKILMMDFSGIYEDQQFWRGKEVSRVEARDIPILLIPETITI